MRLTVVPVDWIVEFPEDDETPDAGASITVMPIDVERMPRNTDPYQQAAIGRL